MRFMVTNLRHVGLVVNDLDKLILFYNKLGFKVVDRKKEEGSYIEKLVKIKAVKLEWVKMKLKDNSILELLKYHSPSAKFEKKVQELCIWICVIRMKFCIFFKYTKKLTPLRLLFEKYRKIVISGIQKLR